MTPGAGGAPLRPIVFHLPASWLGTAGTGVAPFYAKLTEGLAAREVPFEIVPLRRDILLHRIVQDDAAHIVNHGAFQHPRVLNAGIAYVYPFWNVDPKGIRAFSSIADQPFRAGDIDADIARPFFRQLRNRLAGKRQSRYPQPETVSDLPYNPVAVFLQSEAHRGLGETCYLDQWTMLETVLSATDGAVVVKPHPLDTLTDTASRLDAMQARNPHLRIVDCNIHDLLAVARRVVTINSAVGIEAYLHRKPVVLCGQSDFHHIADVARSVEELARQLTTTPRARPYDKFIYWYFGLNCLSTTQPDLTDQFLRRVALL